MFVIVEWSRTNSRDSSVSVVVTIHVGRLMSSPQNGRAVKKYKYASLNDGDKF